MSPIEYEIKAKRKFSFGLSELWAYRELLYFFTWRDIKVKYKQTVLGFLWAVLQPLFMMVIFTLIFGQALKVDSDGIPYPVFAYSGLLIWNIFSTGMTNASNSMVANANIIKKIYFPRLIIPISGILVSAFDFLMAFIIYIFILIYFDFNINIGRIAVFLPLSLLLVTLSTFGLGAVFAALNVKYRDFRYVVPYLIQVLFFLNPVVYSTSIFEQPWIQKLIAANPVAGAINMSRYAFIDKPIEWELVGISAISAVILVFVGIYIFRQTESYFADLA